MIKVLVVDDHELVRTGLKHILAGASDVEVVGDAETGELAITQVKTLMPDIVLMDINMPGIGGIEATRKIRRLYPKTQIIVVTVHSDTACPTQLYDAGAMGYVTKGFPADELFEAIRVVSRGKPYISNEISRKLTLEKISGIDSASPFSILSRRETQVLMMIIQGKKNQDISDSLCLSPKTISTYRHRLFEKLAVDTDVELIFLAISHGLIESRNM